VTCYIDIVKVRCYTCESSNKLRRSTSVGASRRACTCSVYPVARTIADEAASIVTADDERMDFMTLSPEETGRSNVGRGE
jgi:hypothetical protein